MNTPQEHISTPEATVNRDAGLVKMIFVIALNVIVVLFICYIILLISFALGFTRSDDGSAIKMFALGLVVVHNIFIVMLIPIAKPKSVTRYITVAYIILNLLIAGALWFVVEYYENSTPVPGMAYRLVLWLAK